jgi:HEAT repeat protein
MRMCKTVCWLFVLIASWAAVQSDKKVPTPEEILSGYKINLSSPALIEALSNPEPTVRENAAIVLGRRKERSASGPLKEHLRDAYLYARLAAAVALLQMGDSSAMPVVRDLLTQDSDHPAAIRAAGVLADNGNDEGLAVVVRVATTAVEPMDRVQATRALAAFSKFEADRPVVIKQLASLLSNDNNLNVRRVAASELQNFHSPEVALAFERALSDQDAVIQGLAERYLKSAGRR